MAFKLLRDTYNVQQERILMQNSLTFKVGDTIAPLASYTDRCTNSSAATAGNVYVLGVITGFSKRNGEVISTGQDPTNTPNQITTSATNTTSEYYYANYIPIHKEQVWEGDLSGAIGTTGTGKIMQWLNLSDCRTVDETSIIDIDNGSAPLQLLYVEAHPSNTSKGYFRFAKCLYSRP